MRTLFLCAALAFVPSVFAAAFDKGDPAKGKILVEKQCTACHVSLFGGDGNSVYTRADRKVKNPNQLAARISGCNTNTGAGWFPEDELNVAAHLNKTYYQFK